MSLLFNKSAVLFLSAAATATFCAQSVFAAPPQFTGKLSARRSEFNDFIRRNANKEVSLSVVFDPVSGSGDTERVEEPNDIGSPHPVIPNFSVDDHFYLLDDAGNSEQWKKKTRYDVTARQLKGMFLVTFDESFKDYKGNVSRVYRLRFLPDRPITNTAGRVADEYQIVPGERVGRVFLGDSQEAVRRRLGPPSGSAYSVGDGLTAEAWSTKPKGGAMGGLVVIYRNGKVIQIEATTTAFRTSGGLTFASPPDAWTSAYGRRESVVLYKFPKSGKRPVGYEDWMKKGVAYKYEFLPFPGGSDNNEESPIRAVSLIVHRRGERAIPDKNAEWNGGDLSARSSP